VIDETVEEWRTAPVPVDPETEAGQQGLVSRSPVRRSRRNPRGR